MSEDKPDTPREPFNQPRQGEPPTEPRGGSMAAGILFGALALYIFYVGGTMLAGGPYGWSRGILGGLATFLPIVVYVVLATVLAVRPPTSRLGAGLLIGLGIFALLGGGLCVGSLAQPGF